MKVQTILGHYKEAEEELVTIQSAKYRSEYNYIECLTRCRMYLYLHYTTPQGNILLYYHLHLLVVMNRKAVQAWEIYSRMETSAESLGQYESTLRNRIIKN